PHTRATARSTASRPPPANRFAIGCPATSSAVARKSLSNAGFTYTVRPSGSPTRIGVWMKSSSERPGRSLIVGQLRGLVLRDDLLDLGLGERPGRVDGDRLHAAGRAVARRHVDDPVRVDVEADLDLWNSPSRGCDLVQYELAE